ncbi:formate dehydrogenase H [Variibacter gotjawalensis]|uniref:Formate dehydrogenase H n=1 Tax=Variibacter gotjawalensis TaxID=1333996 RepID=A0A0S3PWU5_9BRAD|nr:formate dehydrogenase subunit alpha [Variibacter gotjawalensis]NIK46229.1 formate dehydrogenase major subunit [Variibacter gotjawalensis]RZS48145.1 formate dehydrogenase major subunit [Variibacter gotjawalensis]BAT60402.1 formate dehydrogenase H [Variibacter gotjawalensis]
MLIKRSERQARRGGLSASLAGGQYTGLDRRTFLARSGLVAGGLGALGAMQLGGLRKAEAGPPPKPGVPVETRKNICTHCSVGCTVIAEVQNGVWIGQEPGWDSPINRGSHCAKGASVRELVHGDRRLKYPMKLVGGQWQKISWDQAINEIGDKLNVIREKSGPESVYWLGSAKFSNEGAYLNRKFAAFWGTNSSDHQARICHSTTVAGVANTWGYGAMTNSYNDIRNSKTMIIMGGNPAEAHPVSLQHLLEGKELQRANYVVIDPRMTRTAAHATEYVRIRPGTDIPVMWGILWHIFKNGWEDKEFIQQRVYGMDDVRKEVEKWTPEEVERVAGVPGAQLEKVAKMFATEKPATLIWCMGATQHTVGTANVRAFCIALLATGNVGSFGGGANIFRGHCNVQGATDLGLDITSLPLYYGLAEAAWKHWSRVWEVEYDWLLSRFESKQMMEAPGIPSTRWYEAVMAPKDQVTQKDNLKAMMIFGHGGNTVTRMPEVKKGMEALDLLVVADPHPTTWAALSERKDGTYLLPICTQFECSGSRTASNRSIQWGEQIVKPIFESKNDYEVMYLLAKKLGFADRMFKNIKVENNVPVAEDILREINRGGWSTGYCGQSPERLKAHMKNQDKFDLVTLRAPKDAPAEIAGDYYGLPWPCWGTPELRHPGTHTLYNTNLHVMDGGGTFRARFGVERVVKKKVMENGVEVEKEEKHNLLAEGSYSLGSEIKDGYPEFTLGVLKKLGWDGDLTEKEKEVIARVGGNNQDAVSWSTDLSGGIQRVAMAHGAIHYGNGKARANAWNLPDGVPVHREPIYTPRMDLVAKYPTLPDARQFRMPNQGFTYQKRAVDNKIADRFPIVLTSGRLVEYEGGGEETRSNRWLAELQQDCFIEINPQDASARGIKDGAWVWVSGAENNSKAKVKALVTERVGKGVAWMPFHFAGWYQGVDQRGNYPKGADPIVLGESVNTLTTYGYDPVTGMQEPKATLCQIAAA